MPNELKIIIDAEIQPAETKIKSFGKTAVGELNKINSSANSLSSDITSSVNKINSSLSSLKVTSLDISINTSGIDAGIKSIQSKFAVLTNPEVNVLANTELAEAKIKDLLTELQTLKGSEIFIRANDVQALKVIEGVEAELNTLLDKYIKLNITADTKSILKAKADLDSLIGRNIKVDVDATAALTKISVLEKELADLRSLQIAPNVSTTQFDLFQKKIDQVKVKINELKGTGVGTFVFKADNSQVLASIKQVQATIPPIDVPVQPKVLPIPLPTIPPIEVPVHPKLSPLDTSKLQNLITPISKKIELEVSTQAAEIQIKSLLTEINGLKGRDILININGTQVLKTVDQIEKELLQLQVSLKKATDPRDVAKLNQALLQIRSSLSLANTNQFSKLVSGSQSATLALGNLGRVAQDLPFGFIGIANNLNPLLESFQRLKVETGSTGGALKALSGSLAGAGGLGIALSAITAAVTFAQIGFQAWFRSTGDGVKDIDALKEEVKSLTESIQEAGVSAQNLKDIFSGEVDFFRLGKKDAETLTFEIKQQEKAVESFGQSIAFAKKQLEGLTLSPLRITGSKEEKKEVENSIKQASDALTEIQRNEIKEIVRLNLLKKQLDQQRIDDAKDANKKQLEDFKKFQDDVIARAKLFNKEFGDTFVVPELEITFFKDKNAVFKDALKELNDIAKGNLQIKIPIETELVQVKTTEEIFDKFTDQFKTIQKTISIKVPVVTEFDFLPEKDSFDPAKGAELAKNLTDQFIKGIQLEKGIPVDIVLDPTLSLNNTKLIDEKIKLKDQFEKTFGDLGAKVFGKINFDNLTEGIAKATEQFANMKLVLDTLTASVSEGLSSAFNNVFDAILEGKDVFKALGESVKALAVDTIKAIAKMFILKAVTAALGGGGAVSGLGGLIGGFGRGGGVANFGLGGAIGSRAFNNVIQIVGDSRLSGNDIVTSYRRTTNTNGRGG